MLQTPIFYEDEQGGLVDGLRIEQVQPLGKTFSRYGSQCMLVKESTAQFWTGYT